MTTLPPSRGVFLIAETPGGRPGVRWKTGAGNEARTRDLNLGKVALYQLSYSRNALISKACYSSDARPSVKTKCCKTMNYLAKVPQAERR